jgi:hypothetical protein
LTGPIRSWFRRWPASSRGPRPILARWPGSSPSPRPLFGTAAEIKLSDDELARIDSAAPVGAAAGDRYANMSSVHI